MFFYARADTHFLLYIYDNMRNELIDRSISDIPEENRIELVLQKSKETSLLRYERVPYNAESGRGPGGWYSMLVKTPSLFNNEQFSVFRAIHAWRDRIARADDDSPTFVMPQSVLLSIAKVMPMDMVALLSIAHSASHSVKSRAGELVALIKSAKAQGKNGPNMMDVLRPDSLGAIAKANIPAIAAKNAPEAMVAVVDSGELRSESSTFWGGAFGSSIWDGPNPIKNGENLRLAVPLPALSSEIFATSKGFAPSSPEKKETRITPVFTPETITKSEQQAFIVKRGGNKRKSDSISDGEEGADRPAKSPRNKSVITLDDIEQVRAVQEKAERKAGRKAGKKTRKAARMAAEAEGVDGNEVEDEEGNAMDVENGDGEEEEEEEEAFDYAKAEPVMHGKRNGGERERKQGKTPWDPYAKSADTPKGMRRLQTERAGKSHTFKS